MVDPDGNEPELAAAAFAILETVGVTLLATAAIFDVMGSNNTAEAIKYVGNNLIDGAETLVSSNGPILTPFPITQVKINKTTIAPADASGVNDSSPDRTDFKVPTTFNSSSKETAK